MSLDPERRAAGDESRSATPELEPERLWTLLHDLMNELTTARLYTQCFLSRLENGDSPNGTEWREAIISIDRAAQGAVGLIRSSLQVTGHEDGTGASFLGSREP